MDLKLIKKQDTKIVVLLKDTNSVFVNTLRRIMLSELPIMAVKRVTFIKNSSALFDEIIALRLGLLPLNTNLDAYTLPEKCSCKGAGCAKCQVTFTLKAEGPLTVYASDIKSQDPQVKLVYGKMPIVQLLKDQELEFEAVATLGTAQEHAKYTAGLAHYIGYPKITIDKVKNPDEVAESCPTRVYEVSGKQLKVIDEQLCILCNACVEINDPPEGLTVEASEKDFIFSIESYGKLSPEEMLRRALDVLDEKVVNFETALEKV